MSERKINLEEILLNKYYETRKNWSLPPIDLRYKQMVLDGMKEACTQTLQLAAENAKIKRETYWYLSKEEQIKCSEIYNSTEDETPSEGVLVNKQSILDTINQIK